MHMARLTADAFDCLLSEIAVLCTACCSPPCCYPAPHRSDGYYTEEGNYVSLSSKHDFTMGHLGLMLGVLQDTLQVSKSSRIWQHSWCCRCNGTMLVPFRLDTILCPH